MSIVSGIKLTLCGIPEVTDCNVEEACASIVLIGCVNSINLPQSVISKVSLPNIFKNPSLSDEYCCGATREACSKSRRPIPHLFPLPWRGVCLLAQYVGIRSISFKFTFHPLLAVTNNFS